MRVNLFWYVCKAHDTKWIICKRVYDKWIKFILLLTHQSMILISEYKNLIVCLKNFQCNQNTFCLILYDNKKNYKTRISYRKSFKALYYTMLRWAFGFPNQRLTLCHCKVGPHITTLCWDTKHVCQNMFEISELQWTMKQRPLFICILRSRL